MAIRVTMTVALRDEHNLVFGTLAKVSDRHLMVESEAGYRRGQIVEFQFSPEGRRASIQGEAVVLRIEQAEVSGGPNSYALRIIKLSDESVALYREWLVDLAHGGGSSSRPHRHHASSIGSSVPGRVERQQEGERRLADLERRRGDRPGSEVSSIAGSSTTATRSGIGRQALRQTLRGFAVRGGDGPLGDDSGASGRPLEVEPILGELPPRPAPRVDPFRSDPPSDLSGVSARGGAGGGLEVVVSDRTDPPRLEVVFAKPRRFLTMYRDHLDKDVLFVRCEGPPLRVDGRVKVRMVLPTEDVVLCNAHVGAILPSGTGLLLHLSSEERDVLRRVYGRLRRDKRG